MFNTEIVGHASAVKPAKKSNSVKSIKKEERFVKQHQHYPQVLKRATGSYKDYKEQMEQQMRQQLSYRLY